MPNTFVREWVVPALATAGAVLLSVFLVEEYYHPLGAVMDLLGASASFGMVVSLFICLPACGFLPGLVAALVSFLPGESRRLRPCFILVTTPGVYVVLAYVLVPGLGDTGFHPLRDWVWAGIFIAASYAGTVIGCLARARLSRPGISRISQDSGTPY